MTRSPVECTRAVEPRLYITYRLMLTTSFVSDFFYSARKLSLVTAAISAGIFNDLGNGSNVDAWVITAQGTEKLRNFVKPNERVEKERRYVCPVLHFCLCSCRLDLTLTSSLHRIHRYTSRRGTTAWKTENIRDSVVSECEGCRW